jgi:hypothetical protein
MIFGTAVVLGDLDGKAPRQLPCRALLLDNSSQSSPGSGQDHTWFIIDLTNQQFRPCFPIPFGIKTLVALRQISLTHHKPFGFIIFSNLIHSI